MKRDLSIEDMDGWLNHNQQERAWDRFGEEIEHPCSAMEDWAILLFVGGFVALLAILGMWMAS